jgi:DeoR family transcriptional regulator, catabolite repression regulator
MSNKNHLSDLLIPLSKVPVLEPNGSLKGALDLMTKFSLGVCVICAQDGKILGILTDGDLRRLILTVQNPLPALLVTNAIEFGTKNPRSVTIDTDLETAISVMDGKKIWDLPVVDADGKLLGILNRHNLD